MTDLDDVILLSQASNKMLEMQKELTALRAVAEAVEQFLMDDKKDDRDLLHKVLVWRELKK